MNEIITQTVQLPEIPVEAAKFVLVTEEKARLLRESIKTINKVGLAKEVYDQKLAEAQEVAEIAVDAARQLGLLLMNIQTAPGRRTDIETSILKGNEVKTKTEITSEMGLSSKQVFQYQQMAQNPEAVQAAIQKAIENGDVVSRTAVMKQIQKAKEEAKAEAQAEMKGFAETIKAQSKREAREEVEAEMKALRQTNKVLKEQAEKTATVVAPEDYEQTKKQVEMLEADNERLTRERKEAIKELQDTKKTLEAVQSPDANQKVVDEAKDSFDNFAIATYNYIRRYGGFVWAFDKWADVPADTKKNFEKAVQALSAFSQQMVNNLGGLE